MNDTSQIHHINYDFNPAGLTAEQCDQHAANVQARLADCFDIDPALVRTRVDPKAEAHDVRVMRAAGSTPDYDRIFVAFRVVTPLWQALHYRPTLLQDFVAPYGTQAVLVRVAKPVQIAEVSNG